MIDGQALDVGVSTGWLAALAVSAGAANVDLQRARSALARHRRNLGIGLRRARKGCGACKPAEVRHAAA